MSPLTAWPIAAASHGRQKPASKTEQWWWRLPTREAADTLRLRLLAIEADSRGPSLVTRARLAALVPVYATTADARPAGPAWVVGFQAAPLDLAALVPQLVRYAGAQAAGPPIALPPLTEAEQFAAVLSAEPASALSPPPALWWVRHVALSDGEPRALALPAGLDLVAPRTVSWPALPAASEASLDLLACSPLQQPSQPAWFRIEPHDPPTPTATPRQRSTAAARATATSPPNPARPTTAARRRTAVPFRLVPARPDRDQRQARAGQTVGWWLPNPGAMDSLLHAFRARSQRAVNALDHAAVGPLDSDQGGVLVLARADAESTSQPARASELPGLVLTPVRGCPSALGPVGWEICPRFSPSEMASRFALRDNAWHLALPLPSRRDSGATAHARARRFRWLRVPKAALVPIAGLLRYALDLTPSDYLPSAPARLLDDAALALPRTHAARLQAGLLSLLEVRRLPLADPRAVGGGDPRVPEPLPPSVDSQPFRARSEPARARGVARKPAPANVASTAANRATLLGKRVPRAMAAGSAGQAPGAEDERDAVAARQREAERAVAARLAEPGTASAAAAWLALADLLCTAGHRVDAAHAWLRAAWHGWSLAASADGENAGVLPRDLADVLVRVVPPRGRVQPSASVTPRAGADWIAQAGDAAADPALRALAALAAVGVAGDSLDSTQLVALQLTARALPPDLPVMARWLLAAAIGRLAGDQLAVERTREEILGGLSLHGLTRPDVPPLLRRLVRLRAGVDGNGADAGQADVSGALAKGGAGADHAGARGRPDRPAVRWEAREVESWVAALRALADSASFDNQRTLPYLLPVAELLVIVDAPAAIARAQPAIEALIAEVPHPLLAPLIRRQLRAAARLDLLVTTAACAGFSAAPPAEGDARGELDTEVEGLIDDLRGMVVGVGLADAPGDPLVRGPAPAQGVERFADLARSQQERLGRYLCALSMAQPDERIRTFWRALFDAVSLEDMLAVIGATPTRWYALLGSEWLAGPLLDRLEQLGAGYAINRLSTAERVQLLPLYDDLARLFRQRALPGWLPSDDHLVPATVARETAARVEAAFVAFAKKVRWGADAPAFAPAIARLRAVDAPALAAPWTRTTPEGAGDAGWLRGDGALISARVRHLCQLGRRPEAIELARGLCDAWRAAFVDDDATADRSAHGSARGSGRRVGTAVQDALKWFLSDLLAAVSLTGNRELGLALVRSTVEVARRVDPYPQAVMLGAAARTLAALGASEAAEAELVLMLDLAADRLGDHPLLLFETVERVVVAALELLSPEALSAHILDPVRRLVDGDAASGGRGGGSKHPAAFDRVRTALIVRFVEWSTGVAAGALPDLGAMIDAVRQERSAGAGTSAGRDNNASVSAGGAGAAGADDAFQVGEPFDLARHWAEWFLRLQAYEPGGSIRPVLDLLEAHVQPGQIGASPVLVYLQQISDHFLADNLREGRAMRAHKQREEAWIRARLATEDVVPE